MKASVGEPNLAMHVVGVVADTKYATSGRRTVLVFLACSRDPAPCLAHHLGRMASPDANITREAAAWQAGVSNNMLVTAAYGTRDGGGTGA
ncbi:MAG: hypothetical protein IPL75_13270 [Acidobacteria bacterium]|nr:hypothetical protein [Acidobacteriota bacterium]